jgi:hypothetical protein
MSLAQAMTETSPWAFGWTAVAGLATALLAGLTAWLAWSTRALARETDQDVRAAGRPILTPAGAELDAQAIGERYNTTLGVYLENTGRGPALNCELAGQRPRSADAITWSACRVSTIAAGRSELLNMEGSATPIYGQPAPDLHLLFIATYEDVARNRYRSTFVLEGQKLGELAVQDVEVEDLQEKARERGLPR